MFLACTNAANQKNVNVTHFDSGFSLYQDTIGVDIRGEKQNFLETFLTQKLGQPSQKRKGTKNPWTIWKTPNGLTVELSNSKTNYNNIRLVIYKN